MEKAACGWRGERWAAEGGREEGGGEGEREGAREVVKEEAPRDIRPG